MNREELQMVDEREASVLLGGIPINTLRHWRRKVVRKGPRFVKFDNGTVRYRLSDLDSYINEKVVETASKVTA